METVKRSVVARSSCGWARGFRRRRSLLLIDFLRKGRATRPVLE